ncbi:hypothetical protein, partial [Halorubellus sp. PRR65]|uniref:hypothetical protein n=1 Tax=Halorubellus sp. PRR65 TaxID=3098148 RepID=UPI002B25A61C
PGEAAAATHEAKQRAEGEDASGPADSEVTTVSQRRGESEAPALAAGELVVVKESADSEDDFPASMAEMIAANDDVR